MLSKKTEKALEILKEAEAKLAVLGIYGVEQHVNEVARRKEDRIEIRVTYDGPLMGSD